MTFKARRPWRSQGFSAHCGFSGQKLTEQRFLFLGGGSAATGIAELNQRGDDTRGSEYRCREARNALFDINGLMVRSRTDLAPFQQPFAQDHAPDR